MAKLQLGVLISGRGSNLQALIDACADPTFPATIAVVISNEAGAYGLERAKIAGIPSHIVPHRGFESKAAFEATLDTLLREAGVGLVCLAGFMRLLSPEFVNAWHDRLINIHPSLLPEFKGLDTHARVLAAGKSETGCTVHFVRPEMDDGPIIVQTKIPILPGDTPETLAARLLPSEHKCYVAAVRMIADGLIVRVD